MNNLDKDIEYLKGYKYDNEVKQAIENVLWALKGKDCVIETQSHNEEVLGEYIAKLEKELEKKELEIKVNTSNLALLNDNNNKLKSELDTYKKIAELLAENIDKWGMCFGGACIENCKQHIIDWARKEVENGNNN